MVSFKNIITFGMMVASSVFAAPAIDPRDIKARNEFTTLVTDLHARLRSKHSAGRLCWDDKLARDAVRWTNNCKTPLTHSGLHPENAYAISVPAKTEAAIKGWYSEIDMYDFKNPGYNEQTGHFTQVVWKGATKVGCAWSRDQCGDGMWHFFCDYDKGNMIGEFAENVLEH